MTALSRHISGVGAAMVRKFDRDALFAALWATGRMDTAEIADVVATSQGVRVTEAEVCRSLRRPGEMRT